jgi:hypothetical protein
MGARERLEQHSLFLQKFAYRLLTDDSIRLATTGKLVGNHGLFDREMSAILGILYTHNNLVSPKIGSEKEQPVFLLERIAESLVERNFYLPSFTRRLDMIRKVTNHTWKNEAPESSPGGHRSLDRLLRSLQAKMYEVRLHGSDHEKDQTDEKLTTITGGEVTQMVAQLVSAVKRLEADGLPYQVSDVGERATTRRTEFLNARYDEIAAKINTATGATSEGEFIPLLYLHPAHLKDDPEWFKQSDSTTQNWYAVRKEDFPALEEAISTARDSWDPPNRYEDPDILLKEPDPDAPEDIKLQYREELETLESFSGKGLISGKPLVMIVQLPFAPDEIDDHYPTLELAEDTAVGPNMTIMRVESINRMRFAGFVDFDDHYRMMIMWANAAHDRTTGSGGQTYREVLVEILKGFANQFEGLMGIKPEVHKTKSGASYYFTKPSSVVRLVEVLLKLKALIDRVNTSISSKEEDKVIPERAFNREINDDELPPYMEHD